MAVKSKKTKKSQKAKASVKRNTKTGAKSKSKSKTKAKAVVKTKAAKMKGATKMQSVKSPTTQTTMTPALLTVPNVTLAATGGQQVNLAELTGKKIVLYFYPKDMTPGCTIEGHEFTKLKEEFSAKNAVIFGVSRDTVELHEKFKEKECYTIDLLADTEEKLCNAFGVIKDKNMYGKMVRGIERSTFLINEDGQIAHAWRGVKAEGHANEVLEFLKSN